MRRSLTRSFGRVPVFFMFFYGVARMKKVRMAISALNRGTHSGRGTGEKSCENRGTGANEAQRPRLDGDVWRATCVRSAVIVCFPRARGR